MDHPVSTNTIHCVEVDQMQPNLRLESQVRAIGYSNADGILEQLSEVRQDTTAPRLLTLRQLCLGRLFGIVRRVGDTPRRAGCQGRGP